MTNKTQVFDTFNAFMQRKDKKINGVSKDFAEDNPDFEDQNATNEGCWNCQDCTNCTDCINCINCTYCTICGYCTNCMNCPNCKHCLDCTGCTICNNCRGCSDCSYCAYCNGCMDCTNCNNCIDCTYCNDCSERKGTEGRQKLRDYFAAKALSGLLTTTSEDGTWAHGGYELTASECYKFADAMIAERDKLREDNQ